MKSKNMIILVIVLAVLVIIYLVQNMGSDKKTVSESLLDLYPDFNSSSVTKIMAYKQLHPDSGLVFAKSDGDWVVDSYYDAPAKESEIDKLFTDIRNLQGEVRSTSKDLFSDYDIQEDQALHVLFLGPDSTEIAHILFGKGVPQASRSSFLRNYGQDTVYMGTENFVSRFGAWNAPPSKKLPVNRWVDMQLADFEKDDVSKIEVRTGAATYVFEKQEQIVTEDTVETTKDVWVQVQPGKNKLEESEIGSILSRLGAIRGMEIVAGEVEDEHGLNNPQKVASITYGDGEIQTFLFGAEADTTGNARYLKIEDEPHVYKVAKFNYEAIFEKPFKED